MFLQPCLRAHSSAVASSRAPAPRLRWPSATTSPFTSARRSTSRSGSLLTWSQPITPSLADSATNTACWNAGLIPRSLSRICAAVVGYPSCPLRSASRAASPVFARRIFSSFFLSLGVIIFRLPSLLEPRLERLAGIEKDRDRALIDQLHRHHCLKSSSRHRHAKLAKRLAKFLIESFCQFRRRRADEARPPLPPRVAVQRNLRHDQRAAVHFQQRPVHLTLLVFKDAQVRALFRH